MASARSHQTSSSASTSHHIEWDVFISFRGADTRYVFTDYLYDALVHAGIRTFKDDDKIRSGELISNALLQDIHESEIYIVVLSENYASSTWYLDELVEIITRSRLMTRRRMIPVFYNIEPLAVRNQTESFNKAFRKHGTRYDMARLNKWRNALAEVTECPGYLVPKYMSQTYVISTVVEDVSLSINSASCYGPSNEYLDPAPAKWDVFISCRDTRCTFIGHLFDALDRSGVRIFREDPELHSIEAVTGALSRVIEESKIYVVVFSDKYASSGRCLNVLTSIFKYRNTTRRLILPVFYHIEPSTVRYQIRSFEEAFQKHARCTDKSILDEWHDTLTKVGEFSGYQVHKDMSQIDTINKVVDRVLLEKNSTTLNVANDPVGLNSPVKGITKFLSNVTEHVIKFGIHGMGNGKTTLAKALFKQLWPGSFKRCCFLENVKEVSGTDNGLVQLQQQLIKDMLPKHKRINIDNVAQGIEVIRSRFCSMKVLMVIDNVNDPGTLEFLVGTFALGSIIIITTENEDLLDSVKVEAKYKVNGPGDAASRQICWSL